MTQPVRILRAGRHALLAEYATLVDTMAAFRGLSAHRMASIRELVPAARTVLVRFTIDADPREINEWILATEPQHDDVSPLETVSIDVVYDGEDLADVADLLGISPEAVIARHTSADYRVAFTGFAPGFAYLVAGNEELHVPRRESPRSRVPAGSVGLAGEFSGIYPRSTPGGWQLIGRTNAIMFDDRRPQPALLRAGMGVRFTAVRAQHTLEPPRESLAQTGALEVVSPGVQLTVQDRGRSGHAAEGVPAAGAMDRAAHDSANDAVGNTVGAATLEIAFGGAVLEVHRSAVFAVTGAPVPLSVEDATGAESSPERGVPFLATAGSRLTFGFTPRGTRAYLAARGGFDAQRSVGSRSTDTLSGLGAPPLRAGDTVGILPTTSGTVAMDPAIARDYPAPGESVKLRVTLGPRNEWFTAAAITALATQPWQVSALSDRVGARLEGETPLERCSAAELPSEGVVRGSIQVPANGVPVIFLADHPVTGGYPVIAVVVDEDLHLAAQLPPGAIVTFEVVEL